MFGEFPDLYEWIWPMLAGNCHVNRPSEQFLREAGDWNRIELKRPTDEDACTLFPRISGVLTK